LRSCHCEATKGGRGNLIMKRQRLLRFARNDIHRFIGDKVLSTKYDIRDMHDAIRATSDESLLSFQAGGFAELIDHVGFFPGEVRMISAEVTSV
jgi:hypothetical protein